MAAKLVAEEGILKGLVLSLEEGNQWIIGRDPDVCQLLIEDPSASRRHLICHTSPDGVIVENLSTTNPIQVNDVAVEEPRLLQNGDTVRIGAGLYRFYAESEAHVLTETTNGEEHPVPTSRPLPEEEELAHIFREEESPPPESDLNGSGKKEEPRHDTILEEEPDDEVANINFDISDTGRWLLKVIGGPNNGAEFSMHLGTSYLIGTDPNSCDIVFHDNSVSRQHAKINISENGQLFIEDLKSRNGTLVDGETLTGKKELAPNSLVSVGTSSFVVYDREGEMQTIISPLLPSIVKTLQKEEPKQEPVVEEKAAEPVAIAEKKPEESLHHTLGAFIFIAILTGLFVIVGIGVTTLFKSEPVVTVEQVNTDAVLKDALAPFPNIKYSFNKGTGRLLLVGHVLTGTDKNQLLYNLQGLSFIKSLDDSGIIIDEYVWREINQIIARNPTWKGITVHSQEAGRFVLTGYLQTRTQAEQLWNYINNNFPYLDLLEKRVIVEEDVITAVNVALQSKGLREVSTQIANGELTLSGRIPAGQASALATVIEDIRAIPGVRDIKNFVVEAAPDQSMVNISDEYEVTGASRIGNNLSVIINGRILTQGDILDGMTITSVKPNVIFLEKEGVKYRIDYSH